MSTQQQVGPRIGSARRSPVRPRWPWRVAVAAAAGWGVLHVVGGVVLVAAAGRGAVDGLASLGSAVTVLPADAPTGDAARVAAAVVGFHGFDIAAAGAAVLALAVLAARGRRGAMLVALGVAAVLDVGLVAFLLLPGLVHPAEAAMGLGLLAAAALAAALSRQGARARRRG